MWSKPANIVYIPFRFRKSFGQFFGSFPKCFAPHKLVGASQIFHIENNSTLTNLIVRVMIIFVLIQEVPIANHYLIPKLQFLHKVSWLKRLTRGPHFKVKIQVLNTRLHLLKPLTHSRISLKTKRKIYTSLLNPFSVLLDPTLGPETNNKIE